MLSTQIAKFKLRQYQLRAISPNLMLAKITHYNMVAVKQLNFVQDNYPTLTLSYVTADGISCLLSGRSYYVVTNHLCYIEHMAAKGCIS